MRKTLGSPGESGAGNESRTRDLNLGKVALYQLSYSRGGVSNYTIRSAPLDVPDKGAAARYQRTGTVSRTVAIASATYSMFFELSAATQMRPVSIA